MHRRTAKRPRWLAVGAATVGAVVLTLFGATAASAHVSVSSNTAEAGSYAILTFSVPHGCDGSATTKIAIQIPDGINSVTPTRVANYTVDKVMAKLEPAITDAHGNEVTERVDQVVYTATTPLPDGYRDAFELSLQLPEDAADTTLYFPIVQTCEKGETGWVQIPADGQEAHDLDNPAPAIAVVAAGEASDGHGNTADSSAGTSVQASATGAVVTSAAEDGMAANTAAAADGSGNTGLVVTALIIGALGLAAGVIALVLGRRRA